MIPRDHLLIYTRIQNTIWIPTSIITKRLTRINIYSLLKLTTGLCRIPLGLYNWSQTLHSVGWVAPNLNLTVSFFGVTLHVSNSVSHCYQQGLLHVYVTMCKNTSKLKNILTQVRFMDTGMWIFKQTVF